jgi:hypothetical protein
MGNTCHCQRVENEDEVIYSLLNNLNLNEIEVKSAYNHFLKCYNRDECYLDYFLYKNYIQDIVGNSMYKHEQVSYFESLGKLDRKNLNVKLIGMIIIFLSKGSSYEKIDSLFKHYYIFYCLSDERTVKEFLRDVINSHTDTLLIFRGITNRKVFHNIWKKDRKKSLINEIYQNYVFIKNKYAEWRTKLSMTDSFKPTNKENIEICEKYNNTHCEFYNKIRFKFIDEKFSLSKEELMVREFLELSFTQLNGEYVRTWLYEESIKDKGDPGICLN